MYKRFEYGEFKVSKKSEKEIQLYEIENGLGEIDRAKVLIAKKNDAQMLSVLNSIPKLLDYDPIRCEKEVLAKVLKNFVLWDQKALIEAAPSFMLIAKCLEDESDSLVYLYK